MSNHMIEVFCFVRIIIQVRSWETMKSLIIEMKLKWVGLLVKLRIRDVVSAGLNWYCNFSIFNKLVREEEPGSLWNANIEQRSSSILQQNLIFRHFRGPKFTQNFERYRSEYSVRMRSNSSRDIFLVLSDKKNVKTWIFSGHIAPIFKLFLVVSY